jgi:hypothetical protein
VTFAKPLYARFTCRDSILCRSFLFWVPLQLPFLARTTSRPRLHPSLNVVGTGSGISTAYRIVPRKPDPKTQKHSVPSLPSRAVPRMELEKGLGVRLLALACLPDPLKCSENREMLQVGNVPPTCAGPTGLALERPQRRQGTHAKDGWKSQPGQ